MACHECHCRKQLRKIREELHTLRFLVSRPGKLSILTTKEVNNMISFDVILPAPPADIADWKEIASGELVVSIAGESPIVIVTDKAAQDTEPRLVKDPRFVAEQDSVITLAFNYIDDAGNVGSSTTATVVLRDTVPPVAPGEIGLIATGEV